MTKIQQVLEHVKRRRNECAKELTETTSLANEYIIGKFSAYSEIIPLLEQIESTKGEAVCCKKE